MNEDEIRQREDLFNVAVVAIHEMLLRSDYEHYIFLIRDDYERGCTFGLFYPIDPKVKPAEPSQIVSLLRKWRPNKSNAGALVLELVQHLADAVKPVDSASSQKDAEPLGPAPEKKVTSGTG